MKKSALSIEQWKSIVAQYQTFDGTIKQFCLENHISKAQLYYYRKKFEEKSNSTEFCQVTLESTKVIKSHPSNDIIFNIGNHKITIPANERELVIQLAKELIALC